MKEATSRFLKTLRELELVVNKFPSKREVRLLEEGLCLGCAIHEEKFIDGTKEIKLWPSILAVLRENGFDVDRFLVDAKANCGHEVGTRPRVCIYAHWVVDWIAERVE